jgi:hypothetical protein
MAEEPKPQSWWQTLPGILTAMAGIITAIAGLVVALHQAGFIQDVTNILALEIRPPVTPKPPPVDRSSRPPPLPPDEQVQSMPKTTNLLSSENGGHLVVGSSSDWVATIDGKKRSAFFSKGAQAVYAFKEERRAAFDMFTMLIPGTKRNNVNEFELLVSNDSPTGAFESIGKFQTQNVRLFATPYQQFKFPAVTAKYLKVKVISSFGAPTAQVYEFQLFGNLEYSR